MAVDVSVVAETALAQLPKLRVVRDLGRQSHQRDGQLAVAFELSVSPVPTDAPVVPGVPVGSAVEHLENWLEMEPGE
jgi:hypothetical protein